MKAFLNISPKNNFQRFINFLQPWLTTVVFPYNIVKLEMLLKLIQCLKFHFFNGNRPWSFDKKEKKILIFTRGDMSSERGRGLKKGVWEGVVVSKEKEFTLRSNT